MFTFLRNICAVVLLQPAQFVDPHPRTLRLQTLGSVLLAGIAAGAVVSPGRLLLFNVIGLLCVLTGPWPWSRSYGGAGRLRAAFAYAWCVPLAIGTSDFVGSMGLHDLVVAGYLFLAISLQARHPRQSTCVQRQDHEPAQSSCPPEEREQLRAARAALDPHRSGPSMGLTWTGAVVLVELGPPIARWKDVELPSYVVDEQMRRWDFHSTVLLEQGVVLLEDHLVLAPGAIYQQGEPGREP